MNRTPHETVEHHVAALNHGDLAAVLDTFEAYAVFASDGGTARGREELAALFRGAVEGARPTTIIRRVEVRGNAVECRLTRRFTVQDDKGRVAAAHDVEVNALFLISEGLISEVRVNPIE